MSLSDSSPFDKKQLIHIGIEVVAFCGVLYYFHSKTKKLNLALEEMDRLVKQQNDKINVLERTVGEMANLLQNSLEKRYLGPPQQNPRLPPQVSSRESSHVSHYRRQNQSNSRKRHPRSFEPERDFQQEENEDDQGYVEQYEDLDNEEEEDLDAELGSELQEMEHLRQKRQESLKKE